MNMIAFRLFFFRVDASFCCKIWGFHDVKIYVNVFWRWRQVGPPKR